MATLFITRHPGAREWALSENIKVDEIVTHLDVTKVSVGDVVIGTLPVNLAAEVCARNARYLHLSLDMPEDARGLEISAEMMRRYGVRLEEYRVDSIKC